MDSSSLEVKQEKQQRGFSNPLLASVLFTFSVMALMEELSFCCEAANCSSWHSCLWKPFNFMLQCSSHVVGQKMSLTPGLSKRQIVAVSPPSHMQILGDIVKLMATVIPVDIAVS